MDKGRFSLIQLDPSEIYFEDFSVFFIPADTTVKTYETKKQDGRLKMCSKSLVFDPRDISKPVLKIQLKDCTIIEKWKGSSRFIESDNVLAVHCKEYIEMFESNIIAPYIYKGPGKFLFILKYGNIMNCLPQISQLHRASSLPPREHIDMIATIVHSRQARVSFDQLWLDLYEKIVLESQADKVTPLVVNPGRILLTTSRIYFQPFNNAEANPVIKIELSSINRVLKRRFLLRHIGLEIYSNENSMIPHIYLSFSSPKMRDDFYKQLLEQSALKLSELTPSVMTLQWQNGSVSNFEYLMYVNSLGDRTINDLTQYPVFPWIISNYTSKILDLNDANNYRDLSKPIGALNPTRLEKLIERYDEMAEPKFLYGSHYSTPGFVLFYLARLYPHYVLRLQSGRFDHPDRMFNSMYDVYKNCLNCMSDFKELIPEFYDTSQAGKFLKNEMGINFGNRHNGIKVGDVELPPWAKNAEDFVMKLRNALESEIVSENLHNWIDLIFGYKQQSEEAIKANNVFYYLCYEGKVDLDSITDLNQRHALEVQIMEFGQIPKQVFTVPHPKRRLKASSGIVEKWQNCAKLNLYAVFGTHKCTVSFITISTDQNNIISVGHDSILKVFSIDHKKQIRSATIGDLPLSSCIQLPNVNVLVIGSWDNQIVLFDLDYGRITESVYAHDDAITCMSWGNKTNILVSGSSDCTVRIWKGLNNKGVIKPIQCLYKHIHFNSSVNCVVFTPENDYLAVGTEDGEISIWETSDFTISRKYQFNSGINCIDYSPDSTKLAVGDKNELFQIIDTNTGMAVFKKSLNSCVTSMKWRDSLLVLGCQNGSLLVWNIIRVEVLHEFKGHEGAVTTVDISENESFCCSAGEDHLIKIWRPE